MLDKAHVGYFVLIYSSLLKLLIIIKGYLIWMWMFLGVKKLKKICLDKYCENLNADRKIVKDTWSVQFMGYVLIAYI